jgi:AcrR family transcriptional regulator
LGKACYDAEFTIGEPGAAMAYRRTERVIARLAARQGAIIAAARALASESGMAAVQIVPVATRAGIAAGTVYRYFPSKDDLVSALVDAVAEAELAAVRAAAAAAPGPLSALAAAIMALATRMLTERRLAGAMFVETEEGDARRLAFRRDLAGQFEGLIGAAVAAGHLPAQDAAFAARAMLGALLEGLMGPRAPDPVDADARRSSARMLALFALRGLGVVDARARGLVVQAG